MDKDPSEMTDEELNAAITGEQVEETEVKEESPADPPAEETPKEEPVVEETAEETPEETPAEPAPSRREQLRVQQLLKKYGPPPETPKSPEPSQTGFKAEELIAADPEVIDQVNQAAQSAIDSARDSGMSETLKQLQTVEWRTNLRIDNQQVEQKYPQLNKNSDKFHPVLADAMNRRYLATAGFNPETGLVENPAVSYLEFVEAEFELADEIASTTVAETTKNIAKQAAQTGLRPDGSAAKGMDLTKHPEDMTNEELEAVINNSMPRDNRGRFSKK